MAEPLPKTPQPDRAAGARSHRNTLVKVLEAHQADRARLARFLHDEVAQFLSGIGLQLDILRMDLSDSAPEIGPRTAEIQSVLEQLVQRVRDFSYSLNPEVVERAGLVVALDRLVGHYRKLYSGSMRLLIPRPVSLPPAAASAAYRIVDLAVDNAIRHSGAHNIEIGLRTSRGKTTLEVRDDGRGFEMEPMDDSPGLGFFVMQQYAERAHIELIIRSQPGKGCAVKAVFSVPPIAPLVDSSL